MHKCICIFMILFSTLALAEEVLFVKGGEVEGIYIGSFYLAKEKITNQDYFLFIQTDGYNQKYLWDTGILEKFEDKFKNNSGEKAPRTWAEGSPPVGNEYQPVLGITRWEARALAKQKEWTVPTRRMWILAERSYRDLGEYPWQDDFDNKENSSGILLARYFAPAQIWEERFAESQKEIKSAASVSQVNRNASSIRDIDRKVRGLSETIEEANKNIADVQKKSENDNNERIKNLETLLSQLNEKLLKQESDLAKQNKEQQSNDERLKDLTKLVVSNTKEVEILKKDYNSVSNENSILRNELQKYASRLEQLSKDSSELQKQTKILNSLCPPLPDNSNYVQNILTLKAGFDEIRLSAKKIQTDVNLLQQKDIGIEQQISQLKKQDQILVKEDNKLETSMRNITARNDSQEKDLVKMGALCGQIDSRSKDMLSNIDLLKKMDSEQDKKNNLAQQKLKDLEETILGQEQQHNNLKQLLEQVNLNIKRQKEDFDSTTNVINSLKQRDNELNKSIQDTMDILRGESQNIRKKLYEEQQSELKTISENSNKNATEIKGLENYVENMKVRIENRMESLATDIQVTEQRRNRLETDFRVAATQMRHNMLEVGQKMLQLFEKGMFIGPIPPDKEIHQPQENNTHTNFNTSTSQQLTSQEKEKQKELEKKEKELEKAERQQELEKLKREILALNKESAEAISKMDNEKLRTDILNTIAKIQNEIQTKIPNNVQATMSNEIQTKIQNEIQAKIQNNLENNIQTKIQNNLENIQTKIQNNLESDIQAKIKRETLNTTNQMRTDILNTTSQMRTDILNTTKQEHDKLAYSINNIYNEINKNKSNSDNNSTSSVNNTDMSNLCYDISQIFFENQQIPLSVSFIKLSMQYNPNLEKSKKFWNDNWVELNTPKDMIYVMSKEAIFGKFNDFDFPYTKKTIPSFFMDRHEVTRGEFAEFVRKGYSNSQNWTEKGNTWRANKNKPEKWQDPNAQEEKHPMVNVTYYEAEAYARWQGKRLPTSEEWERAARHTDGRLYPWGDESPKEKGYFHTNFYQMNSDNDGFLGVAPVGSFKDDRSPEGIFDLCGNVAEWCSNHHKYSKTNRAIKGGSFTSLRHRLPGYFQMGGEPDEKYEYVGFRCVKDSPK